MFYVCTTFANQKVSVMRYEDEDEDNAIAFSRYLNSYFEHNGFNSTSEIVFVEDQEYTEDEDDDDEPPYWGHNVPDETYDYDQIIIKGNTFNYTSTLSYKYSGRISNPKTKFSTGEKVNVAYADGDQIVVTNGHKAETWIYVQELDKKYYMSVTQPNYQYFTTGQLSKKEVDALSDLVRDALEQLDVRTDVRIDLVGDGKKLSRRFVSLPDTEYIEPENSLLANNTVYLLYQNDNNAIFTDGRDTVEIWGRNFHLSVNIELIVYYNTINGSNNQS